VDHPALIADSPTAKDEAVSVAPSFAYRYRYRYRYRLMTFGPLADSCIVRTASIHTETRHAAA
jgi:hypothetical protein